MWLIHNRSEGSICKNGLNYTLYENDKFNITFKFWIFHLTFRLRRKEFFKEGTKLFLWSFAWKGKRIGNGAVEEDFDTRTFNFGKKKYSWDLIIDTIDNLKEEF